MNINLRDYRFKTEVELESQYGQHWHTDLGLWGKFDFFGKPLFDDFNSPLFNYEIQSSMASHPMELYKSPSIYATIKGEQHYINFLICEKDIDWILGRKLIDVNPPVKINFFLDFTYSGYDIFDTYKNYSHILGKQ